MQFITINQQLSFPFVCLIIVFFFMNDTVNYFIFLWFPVSEREVPINLQMSSRWSCGTLFHFIFAFISVPSPLSLLAVFPPFLLSTHDFLF